MNHAVDPLIATPPPALNLAIANTNICAVSIPRTLSIFENWLRDGRDHVVILCDAHGVMRARSEPTVRRAQEMADLVAPDGMPIVWLLRLAGLGEASRVCGIDLLPEACRHGASRGWRHFLYGASPGVAEALAEQMRRLIPGIEIAGTFCPPFRPLTEAEDEAVCDQIKNARPDFVWVSLSTPKQDIWMSLHKGKLGGVIMIGVGGAFEINAGLISRAPFWMQSHGLEWLYRLLKEPGRLWKRYLKHLPVFFLVAGAEAVRRRLDSGKH